MIEDGLRVLQGLRFFPKFSDEVIFLQPSSYVKISTFHEPPKLGQRS